MYSILIVEEFFATAFTEDPVKEEPENAPTEGEARAITTKVAVFMSRFDDQC
jgi:hypothetical protein